MATDDDRWSRGAVWLRDRLADADSTHAQVELRSGGHEFARAARERAYTFLETHLCGGTGD